MIKNVDLNKLGYIATHPKFIDVLNKLFGKLPRIISCFDNVEKYYQDNYDRLRIKSIGNYAGGQIIYNRHLKWAKVISNGKNEMEILVFEDGKYRLIAHDNIGYWISPVLNNVENDDISYIFDTLENEYKNG